MTPTACSLCSGTSGRRIFVKDGYDIVRCGGCGLVSIEPRPTPAALAQLYSFASGYHANFRDSEADRRQFLERARRDLRYLPPAAGGRRLLDVGCSAGFFLSCARDAGWNVTGVELSTDSAALARRLYGLEVHDGRVEDAPLAPGSFDVVTLWDVVEHDLEPLALMRRVRALLAPSGHVLLRTPNVDGLFPRVTLRAARLFGRWPHPEPPYHVHQFSAATVTTLLERAGFCDVSVHHERIPVAHSVGTARAVLRSPRRALFALAFAPLAVAGPWLGAGDQIVVGARRAAD